MTFRAYVWVCCACTGVTTHRKINDIRYAEVKLRVMAIRVEHDA